MKKIKFFFLSPYGGKVRIGGFTLVEIIVWITISLILMTSITVFVSSWLNNISLQQKHLEDNYDTNFFFDDFENSVNLWKSYITWSTSSSWILVKIDKSLWAWWFMFIWEKELNNFFCETWSQNSKTNHLFIKKFVPFEWVGADIFSWSTYSSWWTVSNYFSWTLTSWTISFSWEYYSPNDVVLWDWNNLYVSDTINNNILNFNKYDTSKPWIIVAWKWTFWYELLDWDSATWVYLNNPTGLAFWEWKLFISDTLNNRILYLSWSQIYKLLDDYDWLYEPTWLFYNDSRKSLFISNSWKWEILEYSSSWSNNPNLDLSFSPNINYSANKFEIEFLTWSSISNILLSSPNSTWSYTFSGFSQDSDSWTISWNKLNYSFLDNTWTWILKTFSSWSVYWIKVSSINWTNLNLTWSYFVKLSFFSWSELKYNNYFPYYINWDGLLTTNWNNTLKTITWWLYYPTWINFDWNDILVNDFINRKQKKLTINWDLVSESPLKNFDLSIFNYDKRFDNILSNPIKSFEFNLNDNLLTIILKYYKSYNCYNTDEKIERTFISKKNFR